MNNFETINLQITFSNILPYLLSSWEEDEGSLSEEHKECLTTTIHMICNDLKNK